MPPIIPPKAAPTIEDEMAAGQAEVDRDRAINKYPGPERTWDDEGQDEPDRLGGTNSQAPGQGPSLQNVQFPIPPGILAQLATLNPSFAQLAAGLGGGGAGSTEPDVGFGPMLQSIGEKYKALAPHVSNFQVQWGAQDGSIVPGGHLEFYPPWESENPNPGKPTLELYDREMKGPALESAVVGDMLHYLGAVDPASGKAVDPNWRALRSQLIAARDPDSQKMDANAYKEDRAQGETRSFEDWMNESRADAYVRGYLTPDKANEWADVYSPQQKEILKRMKGYLTSGRSPSKSAR